MNPLSRVTVDLAHSLMGNAPSQRQKHVAEHIEANSLISRDAGELAAQEDNFWDRLADSVARVGGSWPFIGLFILFLAMWVGFNSYVLAKGAAFDPYPYIFLNLILSMVAAIQAPIIMMSQNRQAEKDRIAAAHDYEINLRSEIEILAIQEKLDHLRGEQHERILAQQGEILDALARLEARLGE